MYFKIFSYIILILNVISSSASEQVELKEIFSEGQQDLSTTNVISEEKSMVSEVILSAEEEVTEESNSTVTSKIVSEVESQIEENWVISEGDNQNGTRDLVVNNKLVLSETIENNHVKSQKDYYRNGQVANEIIYNGDNKYIYTYSQLGILIDSKQYLNNNLSHHITYDNEGKKLNKTSYYSDYETYTEYDLEGNKSLFLKLVDNIIVERVNYYQDGTPESKEELYAGGELKSITNFDSAGVAISGFGYDQNGALEYQTVYNAGNIDYIEYYYGDEESVKERVYYELGYRIEARFYSYNGTYVSKEKYYLEGEARGELRAEIYFNKNGTIVESSHYNEAQELYREKTYTNGGVIKEEVNYQDNIVNWRKKYDSNGQITDKLSYYENEKVKDHEYYEHGVRTSKEYYDQQKTLIRVDEYLADGNGFKRVTKYYESGIESTVYTYHDGKNIKRKLEYSKDGKLTNDKRYNESGVLQYNYIYSEDEYLVQKRTYFDGERTRDDFYIDEVRRTAFTYNENGSYVKLYYSEDQELIRKDYYNKKGQRYRVKSYLETAKRTGYTDKKIGICNMGTTREANVVVDIGVDSDYANRDYYAYTNKYSQLVLVEAAQIIRQNETFEDVVLGSNGKSSELRYCKTEAQVTGSEPSEYDRGHVLADSMGGAANAYNITPQIEEINLYGAQYLMESMFRKAFASGQTVTNFKMEIKYKNTKTNIPSEYKVSFEINGEQHSYSAVNE